MMFNGVPVVLNALAREVRDEFRVERMPIRKRRRNWRVVRHHIDRPGAYQMLHPFTGEPILVVHPDVWRKIQQAA